MYSLLKRCDAIISYGTGKWVLLLKVPKLVEHLQPIYGRELNRKAADFYFYSKNRVFCIYFKYSLFKLFIFFFFQEIVVTGNCFA